MNNNEPVILGKVKRGSSGKPLVALIIFLFIGSFILFLPTIMDYFGEYSILELTKKGQLIDFFVNHDNYIKKPVNNNKTEDKEIKPILINTKTIIKEKEFTIDNFKLTKTNVSFKINTSKLINFDEFNYYLVLSQNNKEIATIKLTESITKTKEEIYKFKVPLENTVEVTGIIKIIKEKDYPEFILSSDESGLASIICEKGNYKIEYVFNNKNLITLKETLNYIDDNENYLKTFEEYTIKVNRINNSNSTASIVENYSGFIYSTEIDLSTYTGIEKNNSYYSLNTKPNKINFEMNAKGFDCR